MTDEETQNKSLPIEVVEADQLRARVRVPASRIGYRFSPGQGVVTEDIKDEYLRLLSLTGSLTKCAMAVGVHPATMIRHRKDDEDFGKMVEMALEIFKEDIDLEIRRRAIDGWEEPVFYQGIQTGTKRVFSDKLLELYAKRHDPKYRDRFEGEVKHQHAVLVVGATSGSVEQMEAAALQIAATQNQESGDDGS